MCLRQIYKSAAALVKLGLDEVEARFDLQGDCEIMYVLGVEADMNVLARLAAHLDKLADERQDGIPDNVSLSWFQLPPALVCK